MEILLYFGVPMLGAFLIQLMIGCKTKHRILRFIPLYLFAVTLIFAGVALTADTGFLTGGNVIAAAVWVVIGFCILLGYCLALLMYKIKK